MKVLREPNCIYILSKLSNIFLILNLFDFILVFLDFFIFREYYNSI